MMEDTVTALRPYPSLLQGQKKVNVLKTGILNVYHSY